MRVTMAIGYKSITTKAGKEPSTNGTFHNGKRLTRFDKIFLSNGDSLRIGHTELVFKTEQ
jgi:pSer/pThr/pTyr-binding forkhead associated (FHA) protein